MSWTSIPNANLAIGAPIRSIDQLALRDNPIAIAEGATGAPRVRAEALNGGQSGSAPIYAARAWVNFNGTTAGANPAPMTIRASGNVSSVTRNATGDYTVNFTTAMADVNYAVCGMAAPGNGRFLSEFAGGTLNTGDAFSNRTTGSVRVAFHAGTIVYNSDTTSIIVFR